MKAWIVTSTDPERDGAEFVLAETRGKAKWYACLGADYTELRAQRIPELDGIKHPTDWDWYSRVKGWAYNFTCSGCTISIDMDDDDDEFVFTEEGCIWHPTCQQEAEEDWKQTCEGFNRAMQIDDGSILAIREILSDL